MWTLVKEWTDNSGLAVTVNDFIRLGKAVGLKAVPYKNKYSSEDLIRILKQHGPIWCAGTWYGFGHVIALTGVKDNTVYINDPDGGRKKTGSVRWFNERMMNQVDGSFMYKDPLAY